MVKAKIFKLSKINLLNCKDKYKTMLLSGNRIIFGFIVVNREEKAIMCFLKKKLDDDEKLALLKEIFYCFCINEYKIKKDYVSEYLESYMFIDAYRRETKSRVIDCLVDYNLSNFNNYDEKEKIIYHLKLDIDTIRYKDTLEPIELGFIDGFTKKETNIYKRVLQKYLKLNNYKGKLTESSMRRYNKWKKIYDLPANYIYWMEKYDVGIYDSIIQGID